MTENGKEQTVIKILSEITQTDSMKINRETVLVRDLQLDSVLRVELVSRIQDTLGVEIDETKVNQGTTVARLMQLIEHAPKAVHRWKFKSWPLSPALVVLRTALQYVVLFPLVKVGVRKIDIRGLEHLENLELPAVFMPNHVRYFDSAVVMRALPRHIRRKIAIAAARDTIYVKYWYAVPLLELFFNIFPFPRRERESIKPGLDYMGKLIDRGWSILVYPEGKASYTGKIQKLKRGAGFIAVEMDTPVVPIRITGLPSIIPPQRSIPVRRGVVTVTIGKPMRFPRTADYILVTEELQKTLMAL